MGTIAPARFTMRSHSSLRRDTMAWSISDLAKATGIPRSSLYEAIRRGEGPPTHRLGRRFVILAEDLVDWLRALPLVGTQTTTASGSIARNDRPTRSLDGKDNSNGY